MSAATYAIASYLPPFFLDALLNLPAILISIRNKYLPIHPHIVHPLPPAPPSVPAQENLIELEVEAEKSEPAEPAPAASVPFPTERTESGSSSQSNVWSNHQSAASAPGVESSWISVQDDQ